MRYITTKPFIQKNSRSDTIYPMFNSEYDSAAVIENHVDAEVHYFSHYATGTLHFFFAHSIMISSIPI